MIVSDRNSSRRKQPQTSTYAWKWRDDGQRRVINNRQSQHIPSVVAEITFGLLKSTFFFSGTRNYGSLRFFSFIRWIRSLAVVGWTEIRLPPTSRNWSRFRGCNSSVRLIKCDIIRLRFLKFTWQKDVGEQELSSLFALHECALFVQQKLE